MNVRLQLPLEVIVTFQLDLSSPALQLGYSVSDKEPESAQPETGGLHKKAKVKTKRVQVRPSVEHTVSCWTLQNAALHEIFSFQLTDACFLLRLIEIVSYIFVNHLPGPIHSRYPNACYICCCIGLAGLNHECVCI